MTINTTTIATPIGKRTLGFLLSMNVYNIGVNLLWVSYTTILLPILVQNTSRETTKGLWLGVISMTSILAGITINILAGVISDHSQSRWGRRNPTILTGMAFTVLVLLFSAHLSPSLPAVFLEFFLIQVFSNISAGAYQPLLADIVPEHQRGLAAGFQGMFSITGAALGFLTVTRLVSAGQMERSFTFIAAVFMVTSAFSSLAIRKYDQPLKNIEPLNLVSATLETFRVHGIVPGFFWFIFANFLIYMGVYSFASYGIYYFQTILLLPDPVEAMRYAGLVGISVNVIAAVVAGIISDRVGRKPLIITAGVTSGILSLFFPFLHSFDVFLALSALYGTANGIVFSVNQALASSLVPRQESGKYMAYNNLSVGAANAIAPFIFGAILNLYGAPTKTSFLIFFLVAAAFYFSSSLLFEYKVPERNPQNFAKA